MPQTNLYCNFRKLREGPTHVVTSHQVIYDILGAYNKKVSATQCCLILPVTDALPQNLFGGATDDMAVNLGPHEVMNQLEVYGYKVTGMTSFTESHGHSNGKAYVCWTLSKSDEHAGENTGSSTGHYAPTQ
ncbi:hypothetical protein HDE_14127 [Halotydeus destructor]|nr:hypothetical protein HDE_14127 [Halotydeus destructor]